MSRLTQAPPSKNPGSLAGLTGVRRRSSDEEDRQQYYSAAHTVARLTLRSIISDDGHFQGLEVSHG